MASRIEIKGIAKLERKLKGVMPAIKLGIKAGTLHVEGKVKVYPPSTDANSPKTYSKGRWNTWYERGWGSKWALSGGGWHGNKTSENLGRKWTSKITNGGLTGIIGNNVTYGAFVQSPEQQTDAMKRIGWKTTDTVAEEEKETVTDFIKAQIDRALLK